jgi:hypothetical protein
MFTGNLGAKDMYNIVFQDYGKIEEVVLFPSSKERQERKEMKNSLKQN